MDYKTILIVQSAKAEEESSNYVDWAMISAKDAMDYGISYLVRADASYNKIAYSDEDYIYMKSDGISNIVIIHGHLEDRDENNRKIQFSFLAKNTADIFSILKDMHLNITKLGYKIKENIEDVILAAVQQKEKQDNKNYFVIGVSVIATIAIVSLGLAIIFKYNK